MLAKLSKDTEDVFISFTKKVYDKSLILFSLEVQLPVSGPPGMDELGDVRIAGSLLALIIKEVASAVRDTYKQIGMHGDVYTHIHSHT